MSLFKKKSGFDEQDKQGAGKSSGSLIVLLVLLGGFAYLYFFTSLIVPHEPPAPVESASVATEVKQSMPPKTAVPPSTPATAEVTKPEETKPATPSAPPVALPTSTPATPPASAKATAPATPPTTAKPAAPAPAASTVRPAVPAGASPPQSATKPAAAPPITTAPKKDAVPVKKAELKPVKTVESKPVTAVQQKAAAKGAKAAKPVAREKTESYAIFVGEFPAGEEVAAAEAKLARLGIKPVSRKETKKSRSMNRLFYGAYTDYDVYLAELNKLRQSTKGAFGVEKDGTYFLYAGSFSAKDRVEKEKKDLAAKGVTLQIQQTVLSLSTIKLTAGPFSSIKEADNAAAKIKGAGLAAKVVPQRR